MAKKKQHIDDLIGIGWSFPPTFSATTTGVVMTGGIEDIENSLRIIVNTRLGERLMRPDFGCAMDQYVFSPLSTSQQAFITELIKTAILYHEPRIDADEIELEATLNGQLNIRINYTVRATNTRYNFVLPFYLRENIIS